ncbi:MBL fold metallo-hydrolase [Yoonia sp. GPGPB17]|uniref:MBL fold metallo-hydrolase n=1 Tax=Yoonia sp. GPGPB17 TaxID=3026147 RepID=UPI0030BDF55B
MNTTISRRRFIATTGVGSVSAAAAMAGASTTASAQTTRQPIEHATLISIQKAAGATHTFVTNNDGRVTIQVIEGPTGSILVDSGDDQKYAAEARAFAEALGKPIDAVMLSHDHPDHTSGIPSYAGLPIFTSSGILANITNGPFDKPSNLAEVQAFDDAEASFGGLNLRIHNYKNAEALEQIVIEFPELGTAVLQDLVYNNAYFFPGMDRPGWINVLGDLQSKLEVESLLVGHGYPSSQGELTAAIDYLSEYSEMVAQSAGPEELVVKMKERWPDRMAQGILELQGFAFR